MLGRSFSIFSISLVSAFIPLSTGCVDVRGHFDDFGERYELANPEDMDAGGNMECTSPMPGELDGTYLFAIAPTPIDAQRPILFIVDLTTSEGGDGTEVSMSLQALDAKDRVTPVGDPLDIGPFSIGEGGVFNTELPPLSVVGASNPISTGLDIVASVSLDGQFCAGESFHCGLVGGSVSQPIQIPLDGSTYTFELVEDTSNLPDPPKINCAMDEAGPPPE